MVEFDVNVAFAICYVIQKTNRLREKDILKYNATATENIASLHKFIYGIVITSKNGDKSVILLNFQWHCCGKIFEN